MKLMIQMKTTNLYHTGRIDCMKAEPAFQNRSNDKEDSINLVERWLSASDIPCTKIHGNLTTAVYFL